MIIEWIAGRGKRSVGLAATAMLFNSGTFLQFFAAFLLLYYLARNHLAARNALIVGGSYLFYGWWDYRFLALILISSVLDYLVGIGLERSRVPRMRKTLLALSVAGNLGILGFFKYYGFFVESLNGALAGMGMASPLRGLEIVLPVGISFYTFQTMSYTIDVYRGETRATRNVVSFLAYVAFFPQLVAGPIERARHLLPQFTTTLRITRAMLEEGVWLCLWGMFKKVVIADNLAPLVEMVYGHPEPGGGMVVLATVAFGLQIYCDFSGYSDIARGSARLLGFDLMVNFKVPYAACNLTEFWRRWHISLSSWLRDYLYIPLGGNRKGAARTQWNLFLTMLLGGLWHGAAWNFLAWGAWHGIGLMAHRLWMRARGRSSPGAAPHAPLPETETAWSTRVAESKSFSAGEAGADARSGFARLSRAVSWIATMVFIFYGWLLFRAGSWEGVMTLTGALMDPLLPEWAASYLWRLAIFALPLIAMEFWQNRAGDLLAPLRLGAPGRAVLQGGLLVGIVLFWEQESVPFIYFQF